MNRARVNLEISLQYLINIVDQLYYDRNRVKYVVDVKAYDTALTNISRAIDVLKVQLEEIKRKETAKKQEEIKRREIVKKKEEVKTK